MREYKLLSWPELPVEFRRMAFRRLLSDMSHRHLSEPLLLQRGGVKRAELRALLQLLESRQVLDVRQAGNRRHKWRPLLAAWLRRLAR